MSETLSRGENAVKRALAAAGMNCEITLLANSARTAQLAAEALGCAVDQIVKSLVFQGTATGRPVLVLVSGSNRVDEGRLAEIVGEPVTKADADTVRSVTGFAIGGIPPLGHARPMRTYIDKNLMAHGQLWAAAGSPRAVFSLRPSELRRISAGAVVEVV